jgi:hypothetical protein
MKIFTPLIALSACAIASTSVDAHSLRHLMDSGENGGEQQFEVVNRHEEEQKGEDQADYAARKAAYLKAQEEEYDAIEARKAARVQAALEKTARRQAFYDSSYKNVKYVAGATRDASYAAASMTADLATRGAQSAYKGATDSALYVRHHLDERAVAQAQAAREREDREALQAILDKEAEEAAKVVAEAREAERIERLALRERFNKMSYLEQFYETMPTRGGIDRFFERRNWVNADAVQQSEMDANDQLVIDEEKEDAEEREAQNERNA